MKSPKSNIFSIIFLVIITTAASAEESNGTKKAKISNYKPEKRHSATDSNKDPQFTVSLVSDIDNNNYNASGDARSDFLKAHNGVRQRSGLLPLFWDAKLADVSAKYAAQRQNDCNMVHSYGQYGENIFWGSGKDWTPAEVVHLWVREHRFYNRQTNQCTSGQMCGHYTQIVWRNTHRLGCSKITCASGDTFAICTYDPPGNFMGEGPFDTNN